MRGTGSILDVIGDPAFACEVTLQPVRRYGVDAAILFSDIVVPLHAIGFGVDVVPGTGPVIEHPVRTRRDLDRLRALEDGDVAHVVETVRLVTKELSATATPLIGFAGAPFTVASYAVEGGPTRTFEVVKSLAHGDPALFDALTDRLADLAIAFASAQVRAGARRSSCSTRGRAPCRPTSTRGSPCRRRERSSAPSRRSGCPSSSSASARASCSARWRRQGPTSSASTSTCGLDAARSRVGALAVQGNLDPALCVSNVDVAIEATRDVLRRAGTRAGSRLQPRPRRPADDGPRRARRGRGRRPPRGTRRRGGPGVTPPGCSSCPTARPRPARAWRPSTPRSATAGPPRRAARGPRSAATTRSAGPRRSRRAPTSRSRASRGHSSTVPRVASSSRARRSTRRPGSKRPSSALVARGADDGRRARPLAAPRADVDRPVPRPSARRGRRPRRRTARCGRGGDAPGFAELLGRAGPRRGGRVRARRRSSPSARTRSPSRVLTEGTDYPGELEGAAAAIAAAAGVDGHVVCWQSAGRTGDAWLGPDLLELLRGLDAAAVREVVVCPVGFVSDHLEVLYDVDVEAAAVARERGLTLRRTASLNDDPTFLFDPRRRRRGGGGVTHVVVVGAAASRGCRPPTSSRAAPAPSAVGARRSRSSRRAGSAASWRAPRSAIAPSTSDPTAFLARRPEAVALVGELGAADELEPVGAAGAWVLARGRLRRLPAGLALGVPTRPRCARGGRPARRARRAAGVGGPRRRRRRREPLAAPGPRDRPARRRQARPARRRRPRRPARRRHPRGPRPRPLRGGGLPAAARRGPAARQPDARAALGRPAPAGRDAGPAFLTLRGGVGSLPGCSWRRSLAARGVACATGRGRHVPAPRAPRARRAGSSRRPAATSRRRRRRARDARRRSTAALLAPLDADAAAMLGAIDAASVAVVTLRVAADDVALPEGGTGRPRARRATRRRAARTFSTAVTFLDRKWPHLARDGEVLLRASVGRIDDARFAGTRRRGSSSRRVADELDAARRARRRAHRGAGRRGGRTPSRSTASTTSSASRASRRRRAHWAASRSRARRTAGVGVPACIASGRGAARAVRTWLVGQS